MSENKKFTPFDLVTDLSYDKKNIFEQYEEAEKAYNPYLVNMAFSYSQDSILYAEDMNRMHGLSKKSQNDFYLNSLRKRKRYNKWAKPDPEKEKALKALRAFYKFGTEDAECAYRTLTEDAVQYIIYLTKTK